MQYLLTLLAILVIFPVTVTAQPLNIPATATETLLCVNSELGDPDFAEDLENCNALLTGVCTTWDAQGPFDTRFPNYAARWNKICDPAFNPRRILPLKTASPPGA